MRPVETIPGMGGGRIKENDGGVNQVWYISYIVRTFVNATMYPQYNNTKQQKRIVIKHPSKNSLPPQSILSGICVLLSQTILTYLGFGHPISIFFVKEWSLVF
jgi:hypothetical protein